MAEDRFAFVADWYDEQADLVRRYQLLYFLRDSSVEMYDLKNRRTFLKRTEYPSLARSDLYLGNKVQIFGRLLTLSDYADEYTANQLSAATSKTLAIIKPDAYVHTGKILKAISNEGFVISKLRMARLQPQHAQEFYAEHVGKPFFPALEQFMTSDVCTAIELIGTDSIQRWRSLIGPTNTEKARAEAPNSLRARFGTDGTRNACHGSDSDESASRESNFFFGSRKIPTTAVQSNCTCCIIKPHAVKSGLAGDIIDAILEDGFEISAMELFNLERAEAEEFLEVYKGVIREQSVLVDELLSGALIALEIRAENAVQAFRELCGPSDPEIAKHLRPKTLRARFGVDKVKNAVHCTDLPEDGQLEVEYFFSLLQK